MTPQRAIALATAFVALCSLVMLTQGPMLDDWVFLQLLDRGQAPYDLYDFGALGQRPTWYVDSEAQVRFFRPLASLSFALDAALLPPWAWHLENTAWLLLLCAVVAWTYRQLGEGWWWGWASVLWILDDAHAGAWTWAGHRNALLATTASLLSLGLFLRARRAQRTPWAALAVFFVGLGCGELALVGLAYPFAWAVTAPGDERRSHLIALLPFLGTGITWRLGAVLAGYGTHAAGLYVDPASQPLLFARTAVERMPLLLTSQALPIWVEATATLPALREHHLALGIGTMVLGAAVLTVFREPLLGTRRARFFVVALLASTLPLAAAPPHDRLLLLPGFAFFGLAAELVTRGGPVAAVLLTLHVGFAALGNVPKAMFISRLSEGLSGSAQAPEVQGTVYALRSPGFYSDLLVQARADHLGHDLQLRPLARAHGALTVDRAGERSLVFRLLDPERHFFDGPSDHFALGVREPDVGSTWPGPGFDAQVLAVHANGLPTAVRFDFHQPLEGLTFADVRHGSIVPTAPPDPGEQLRLHEVDPASPILFDEPTPVERRPAP